MKNLIRYIKRNSWAIFKSVLLAMAAVVAFKMAHNYATADRGYIAYGGEIFIPFVIIFGKHIWAMIKESFGVMRNEY